ncbi:MAG: hypothetical protein LBL15_01185 [Oscillospiraceae bacterium]|jgi:hypothetical protein|nr:hypothetical protein [Oscillospiraceae bacterium]
MEQQLYDMAYQSLLAIALLSAAVATVMEIAGIGGHPVLSPIIGSASGIGLLFIFPATIVPAAVTAVVITFVSAFALGKLDDILEDKYGEKTDAKVKTLLAKSDNREYQKILYSPDAKERVKFLSRHMRNRSYCFLAAAAAGLVYQAARQKIESSSLQQDYPEASLARKESPGEYVLYVDLARAVVVLIFKPEGANTDVQIGLGKYDDQDLGLKESIRLEERTAAALDKVYLLTGDVIKGLDPNAAVSIK